MKHRSPNSALVAPLAELRKRAGLTQAALASRLHMSRPAYGKLETGQTALTVERAYQIAKILKLPASQVLPLPTPDPSEVGTPAAELVFLRAIAENQVLDAMMRVGMDHQEPIPFDELGESEWEWLRMNNVETREQYEAAPMLVSRPVAGQDQLAFERMLRNSDTYSLFQHGIIQEEFLLQFWRVFQAKDTPYFEFESRPFGPITKQLSAATEAANTELDNDHLQGETEEFWKVVQQGCDARHISWCLEGAVFHFPEPEFARLRTDRAEYNRTLVRLIGNVWVTGMSADNIVGEEGSRLRREGYSEEFQAYCDEVAAGLWGAGRGPGTVSNA